MALSRAKAAFLLCNVLAVATLLIIYQSECLNTKPKVKDLVNTPEPTTRGISITPTSKITTVLSTTKQTVISNTYTLKTTGTLNASKPKDSKWKKCKRLIWGEEELKTTFITLNDSKILNNYKPDEECALVLRARFPHPPVSEGEQQLPIAYGFTIYKGARCLPKVFVAKNRTSVEWGHFTVIQAQMNCMEELLQSAVKWKYYINLIGQDFPLYDNRQIVRALQRLNNTNNIYSVPMPKNDESRTKVAWELKNHRLFKSNNIKSPPPHNISICKGSTHIVAIREFVEFVLHSQIGKNFTEFLKDTLVPDETLYSSLQQHPLAPGGIQGKQPTWIPRALYWLVSEESRHICHGTWVRSLCWISIKDLSWAFG